MPTKITLTGKTRHRVHVENRWLRRTKTYLVLQVEYHEVGKRERYSPDPSDPVCVDKVDGYYWRDAKVEDLNELTNSGACERNK